MVGSEVAPGRYFSDPLSACFWERLSGLGGTLEEVLANNFIAFDSMQEIVAIRDTDLAFSTDEECGDWFAAPRHGIQSDIPPGRWLVGSQIVPGTYQTAAGPGCFWERLNDFSGELGDTFANDFVADGGPQMVTISGDDIGFSSDADCGTWTRLQTLASNEESPGPRPTQSVREIGRNRRLNDEQER